MQFPDRGRKLNGSGLFNTLIRLRNAVPRQGTETDLIASLIPLNTIEKCSSPTGDGNKNTQYWDKKVEYYIEKCSSPTGDGNYIAMESEEKYCRIEKCSSPTGDGNHFLN